MNAPSVCFFLGAAVASAGEAGDGVSPMEAMEDAGAEETKAGDGDAAATAVERDAMQVKA